MNNINNIQTIKLKIFLTTDASYNACKWVLYLVLELNLLIPGSKQNSKGLNLVSPTLTIFTIQADLLWKSN